MLDIRLGRWLLAASIISTLGACDIVSDVIGGGADIGLPISNIDLGVAIEGESRGDSFVIRNTGSSSATVTIEESAPWLSVTPMSTTVPGNGSSVIDVSGTCTSAIGDGAASTTVTVSGAGQSIDVTVAIECSTQPLTEPEPSSLTIAAAVGSTATGTFSFRNVSDSTVGFSVSDSAGILSFSPSSSSVAAGAMQQVDVSSSCSRESDTTTTVTVSYPDGPRTLEVVRSCGLNSITATPTNAFLSAQVTETARGSIQVSSPNDVDVSFSLQNLPTWLSASPSSGTIPGNGSVSIDMSTNCPATRSVQEDAFTVSSSAGDVVIDAFRICSAPPAHDYDIVLRFFGEGFDATTLNLFLDAEEKWERVITNDLEDVPSLSTSEGTCSGPGFPNEPGLDDVAIDDLLIYVGVADIDGDFGIVASAGPCFQRSGSSADPLLSIYGTAFFDSADTQRLRDDGRLSTVVLHEIGHVVGLGTLWGSGNFDLIDYSGDGSTCRTTDDFTSGPSYTGAQGVQAYEELSGSPQSSVPLEDEGGAGTKCGHWDEDHFDTELMTGYVDGGDDPLSKLTGDSLHDLGYVTDSGAYDAYNIPACSPFCTNAVDTDEFHLDEVIRLPRFTVAPDGTVQPVGPTLD